MAEATGRIVQIQGAVIDVEFDRNIVALFPQFDVQALSQAIEGMTQEQDTHAQGLTDSG